MPATRLEMHRVEKPWGRRRLWPGFRDVTGDGGPVGEIWFQAPREAAPDLLVKYLFTSEKLSVQVHPDDCEARARGLPRGKDECWLILGAEPGSAIAIGTQQPLNSEQLREAAQNGTIEQLLDWRPVKAGDFFYSSAGTVHAIGAGLTLVEVQQNSDTTYRLYDYGRRRELHLDEGVAVAKAEPFTPRPIPGPAAEGRNILVEGPKFVLERWSLGRCEVTLPDGVTGWLVPLAGDGVVDDLSFDTGECLALTGAARIDAARPSDLLFAYPGARRIGTVSISRAR